jgi:hypothetical protein
MGDFLDGESGFVEDAKSMEDGGEGVEAKFSAPLESILMIGPQPLLSLFFTGGDLRTEGVIETMGGAVSTPKGGQVRFGGSGRESLLGDLLLAEGLLLFLFCVDS